MFLNMISSVLIALSRCLNHSIMFCFVLWSSWFVINFIFGLTDFSRWSSKFPIAWMAVVPSRGQSSERLLSWQRRLALVCTWTALVCVKLCHSMRSRESNGKPFVPSLIPSTYHGILRFANDISWAVLFVFFWFVCVFAICCVLFSFVLYNYIINYNQMDAWHIQFCCHRYKGFGGMSGALLCSSRSLVSLASDWQVRLGGSVFTQAPQWIDASDLSPAGAFFFMPVCVFLIFFQFVAFSEVAMTPKNRQSVPCGEDFGIRA